MKCGFDLFRQCLILRGILTFSQDTGGLGQDLRILVIIGRGGEIHRGL